ncbi:MAG: HDOD domain-containing protein [Oligoflexales bacterium]|nr:HDOD domain-containing protein [Oligoflexales bacterium]
MKEVSCSKCNKVINNPSDFIWNTTGWRKGQEGKLFFECKCGETLSVPDGEYDWFNPREVICRNAQELVGKLPELQGLPQLPASITKLQSVVIKENSSSKDIEKSLKQIPYLAMSVINAANTLCHASGVNIRSLEHAISYIGRMTISDLVMTYALKTFQFKTQLFDHEQFWRESLVTAKISEYLCTNYVPSVVKDEAYIAAGLCNAGKIVGAICFPKQTDEIYRQVTSGDAPIPWSVAERKESTYTHMVLGEVGASLWGFSEYVKVGVRYHHFRPSEIVSFDARFSTKSAAVAKLVALANQLTHWIMLKPSRMDEPLMHEYAISLGIKKSELEKIANVCIRDILPQEEENKTSA